LSIAFIRNLLYADVGPTVTTASTATSTAASTTAGLKLDFFVDAKKQRTQWKSLICSITHVCPNEHFFKVKRCEIKCLYSKKRVFFATMTKVENKLV